MKKTILEIYALAICFVGIVVITVSTSISVYSILEITSPEFTISQWQFEKHVNNDMFWRNYPYNDYNDKVDGKKNKPSDEKLTELRKDSYNIALKNEQRMGAQSLVRSLIFFVFSAVIFLFHWKLYKKISK